MTNQENSAKDYRSYHNNLSFVNKITFTTLTSLVLILPWFFNEQISIQVETSKNILISITIAFILLVWAVNIYKSKELTWFASPIDKAMFIILIAALLSTFLSMQQTTSIWGYNLRYTGGLMSLLNILLIFTITFQHVRDKNSFIRLVKLIPLSLGLYAFFIFLKTNNILEGINQSFSLGISISNPLLDQSTSIAGDIKAITTLFVVVLPIALFIMIDNKHTSRLEKAFGFLISVGLILGIFSHVYNVHDLLFTIIICSLLIIVITFALIFAFKAKNRITLSIILSLILMGVSIIGLLNNLNYSATAEASIPIETTTSIITNAIAENPARVLFGTGLDTYTYAFAKYRPETQNLRADWYINYSNANSQFEGVIINSGIMGILGVVSLIYLVAKFIAVKVLKARLHSQNNILLALCTSSILFLFSFLITNHSATFSIFGWLILALLFIYCSSLDQNNLKKYIIEIKLSSRAYPKLNNAPKIFSLIIALIGSIILVTSINSLLSEIYLQQAQYMITEGQYEDASNTITKAIKHNAGNDYYYSELAAITRVRLNSYLETIQSTPDYLKDPIVSSLSSDLESSISKTIQLNPADYHNWQAAAIFYKQLFVLLKDSRYEQAALQAIEQAIIRYPTGPDNYLVLAEIYEIGENPEKMALAEAAYTKAYSLQPSYIVSIMRLGKFLEMTNKTEMALALYSISKQEFYLTDSDFNSYLTVKISALKYQLEE